MKGRSIADHYRMAARLAGEAGDAEGMNQANKIALAHLHLDIARQAGVLQDIGQHKLSEFDRRLWSSYADALLGG